MRTLSGHQIYNWHLEVSSKCTLKCPRCTRTEYPGTYPFTQLGLAFIQNLFSPELLRNSVQRITFSGGVGDPIYNSELPSIFRYLKETHPGLQIVLVTNGSYKTTEWWQELLKPLNSRDEIVFSIDGWDQISNNLYRVNSDWQSIMVGVDQAVRSPALVRWSSILFKFNEDHVAHLCELAKSKGVDSFHAVLSERFGGHYRNPNTGVDPLEPSPQHKSQIPRTQRFKENFQTHPHKRQIAREVNAEINQSFQASYQEAMNTYSQHYILPTCKFGYRGLYVDVEGILYPCSWVSHQFDVKASQINPERLLYYKDGFIKYKDRLNLHLRSLAEILSDPLWTELEQGWQSEQEAFIICERKCLAKHSQKSELQTKPLKEIPE